jgi:CxxC-x17-CxxC domain-containing protein
MKNETEMLESINKIQALLIMLDKKVDALMRRQSAEAVPIPKPALESPRNNERVMHKAICADCKKECSLPFKPSGDRPVYCQDCFSRRKVIKMSGITVADKPPEVLPLSAEVKTKKKVPAAKKPIGKKKPVPKKK